MKAYTYDLSSMQSVREFAAAVRQDVPSLNVLLNNAGQQSHLSAGQTHATLACIVQAVVLSKHCYYQDLIIWDQVTWVRRMPTCYACFMSLQAVHLQGELAIAMGNGLLNAGHESGWGCTAFWNESDLTAGLRKVGWLHAQLAFMLERFCFISLAEDVNVMLARIPTVSSHQVAYGN